MYKTIEDLFDKDAYPCGLRYESAPLNQSKSVSSYEHLLQLLGSEGKPQLDEFISQQLAVSCDQEKQAFTAGFRLGARLMLEVMED